VGVNDDGLGPRFPDMSSPYDRQLIEAALEVARQKQITCHRGVYVGMLGPTYETRAEYRMVRQLGGDVAGMSTVPEVITAVHAGLRVLGISTVTNVFREAAGAAGTTHGDVLAAANSAGQRLEQIVRGALRGNF
jgi:purine-nucleoside phosphorylase